MKGMSAAKGSKVIKTAVAPGKMAPPKRGKK